MKLKDKHVILTIIAVVTLVSLVVGATYAYFAVGTTDNFNTTVIRGTAESIGSVTMQGTNASLSLTLSEVDMMVENANTYYASSSGKTTTPTTVTIGTASVTPSTDTNYYHCTYELSVSHTGTNDMYNLFNQQTNSNKSQNAGQIVLTINGVDYDFIGLLPSTIHSSFYTKVGSPVNLTAGLRFVNSDTIDQTYLAGSDINITIGVVENSLKCEAVKESEPSPFIAELTGKSGFLKYNGKVTDVYTDFGEGVDAQKVYYVTNNDIANVIFGDYCWKIIRTTETGGTKLLYNGEPVDGKCTTQTGNSTMINNGATYTYSKDGAYGQPAYVGYMYNATTGNYYNQLRADNVNENDSNLKTVTENWFASSGIDASKLEHAVFCNDRSLDSRSPVTEANLSTTTTDLSPRLVYFANSNKKTTLECTLETDAFSVDNPEAGGNGKMANVGFMSVPEARLITDAIYNNSSIYWLGSPATFDGSAANVRYVRNSVIGYNLVDNTFGVRPVVSINSGVSISSGDGSSTSPWIVN